MKKINYYEFNDAMGGMMLAKNLKQAVKMIAKYHKYTTVDAILKEVKRNEKNDTDEGIVLTNVCKFTKTKNNRKTEFYGFCD